MACSLAGSAGTNLRLFDNFKSRLAKSKPIKSRKELCIWKDQAILEALPFLEFDGRSSARG